MIVRISTEGQYRLGSAALDQLNDLDNQLVQIVEDGKKDDFAAILAQLLDLVRREGQLVSSEELVESDIILPPPDISFEEARHLFTGEGLVPDEDDR